MRGTWRFLPLLLIAAPEAGAGVVVKEAKTKGQVDVAATAAPLSDVLDRLARQTGMEIVYEGTRPRQLVTLSLAGRSPAEAVASILEGQGLNYALLMDATATRVEKLLVTGQTPPGARAASRPSHPPPRVRQLAPPEDDFEGDDLADEAEPVDPPSPALLAAPPGLPPPPPDPTQAQPVADPAAPAADPAAPHLNIPALIPDPGYSSSPFNPKPLALPTPQPTPTPTPDPAAPPPQ
jgi:hypothetical protein